MRGLRLFLQNSQDWAGDGARARKPLHAAYCVAALREPPVRGRGKAADPALGQTLRSARVSEPLQKSGGARGRSVRIRPLLGATESSEALPGGSAHVGTSGVLVERRQEGE